MPPIPIYGPQLTRQHMQTQPVDPSMHSVGNECLS